jgi:hypothetical protein
MNYPESFNELESWRDELRRTLSGGDLIRAIEGRIESESDPVRLRILNFFLADEHIAQGNEAAAAAIRAKDPIEEIHCWHAEWRQANGSADIIPILKSRISRESDPMKINALRYFLANEYRDNGDYAASSAVYLDEFNDDPSEPMPLITLAGQKLFWENQPEEAMRIIDQAVDAALRSGTFRRLALGFKARIGLRIHAYRAVEDALKQIMELTFTRGNLDIRIERDFLDQWPPGSIDPAVARRYGEYCRTSGKQS